MVILIAVALAGAGSVTTTQAASFGSCGCAKTGPFVDAKHGVKPTPNPPAGSPFSIATSTAGEPPGITDVKVSSGATQLLEVQTQKWGFSPDNGNRFVAWSVDSGTGVMSVQLYDLTSTTPQSAIWTGGTPSGTSSAAIQFSPTGHFIQLSAISGATDLYLTIRDARTGALKLEDTLTPSSAADTGDDNNVAGWGYGPGDLGFVFAFLNSSSEPQLELVNLANGNVRDIGGVGTSASAFWQFSPCGDVLGVVGDPGGGPLLADMYSLDGTHLGEVSGVTAPVVLAATSNELTANGTNVAPNTAGQSCGGGGGSSLVVNFTVSGIRHVGSTITFTDTSTDTTGTINSWSWDFGDGQTSTAENPAHSYTAAGSYTVKLTVKDTAHASSSRQKTVTIGVNKPPKASFTFTPTSPSHGDPVTFTDTSTDDVGVTFIQWTINGQVAGDTPGDSLEIQACTTLHVKLTAFDGDGQSNTTPVTTIPVSTAAQITNVAAGGSIADAVAHSCPGDIVTWLPVPTTAASRSAPSVWSAPARVRR